MPILGEIGLLDAAIGTGPSWLSGALTLQGVAPAVAAWVAIVVLLHRGLAQVNEAAGGAPVAPGERAA